MGLDELMRMVIIFMTFYVKYYLSFHLLLSIFKETFTLKLLFEFIQHYYE